MQPSQFKKSPVFIFCFFIATGAAAQLDCASSRILGKWKEIASMPGVITNLDSAKDVAINTKRNIGTWEFFADKSYQYKHALHRSRYKPKGSYLVDEQTCEIIIASKKYKREDSNLEILHVDDRYLLYKSNNNPKGYFTHLLRKSED
ncbi:MAG TPA: hypothetical protein VGD65_23030 [Chryseosolibacter sp.]